MRTRNVLLLTLLGGLLNAAPVMAQCAAIDRDGDGDVDLTDLSIVTTDFGCVGVCRGDVDGNGMTDFADLNLVVGALGCPNGRICCNEPPQATIFANVVPIGNAIAPGSDPAVLGFYGGMTHYTFDLQSNGADWFGANVNATLFVPGAYFFAHPLEAPFGDPPNPAAIPPNPALEFDSYWTQAAVIPPGGAGIPAGPGINALGPQVMDALWTDTAILPAGTYTLARYTILCPPTIRPKVVPSGTSTAPLIGSIRGCIVSSSNTQPDCFPVGFDIVNCYNPADADADCTVGITDLALILANFGLTCP